MLAHRHYWQMVEMVRRVPGLFAGHDRVLLYLPLAHNFARLVQYAGAAAGFTLAFCPDVSLVAESLQEVRPTIFPSVPRVFEKMYDRRPRALRRGDGPPASDRAARSRRRREGRGAPGRGAAPSRRCSRRNVRWPTALVYRRCAPLLGGELRLAVSGGAPLSREIAEFFASLGILILEGYGLTECTTASHLNWPRRYRFGTVGLALPGVEARIADDGEVLLRAEHGVRRLPRRPGGDSRNGGRRRLAAHRRYRLDRRGRASSRSPTARRTSSSPAGGKNVSPQNIENALRSTPAIAQALVIGDRRPYLTALVVPERGRRRHEGGAARHSSSRVWPSVNRELGRVEQIKRFAVLERDFSAELGEVTPTLKLRRHVCEEHFGDVIDSLYAGTSPDSTPL